MGEARSSAVVSIRTTTESGPEYIIDDSSLQIVLTPACVVDDPTPKEVAHGSDDVLFRLRHRERYCTIVRYP